MATFVREPLTGIRMEGKEGIDALFLYATEGILVVNERGGIVRINPSAEKLFGYEKDELVGKTIEILIPQRYAHTHKAYREKYNQNPHARAMGAGMELFGKKKNGQEFPVEISLSPYTSPEGKFVIAFIIDITLRRQAEEKLKNYSAELELQVKNRTLILEEAIEELEKTKQELNEALEKEKDLNELKSRFVSMASHEFRTPLATILSSLSLVKQYGELNDREKQDKHIGRIKSSVGNLTDILNDFLSISKLEEGRVECCPETFDLEAFITGIVSEMQGVAGSAQSITYAHSGAVQARLDPKLLRHILLNLLSNAIKFSPGKEPIRIASSVSDKHITIAVQDRGIGISEEDQQHLFERFFRAHNATHIQGTGLGLNIVARYLELMNGTIALESKEHAGSTFTIQFPP